MAGPPEGWLLSLCRKFLQKMRSFDVLFMGKEILQ